MSPWKLLTWSKKYWKVTGSCVRRCCGVLGNTRILSRNLEQKVETMKPSTCSTLSPPCSLHLPPLLQGAHATVLMQKFLDSEARLQPVTLVAELVYQLNAKQLWSHFHVDTETVEDEANNTLREERGNNGEKEGWRRREGGREGESIRGK